MRLSNETRETIRTTVREVFGEEARVLLFGSRTDDAARGGDIDLLVELPQSMPDRRSRELTLVARLQRRLGDREFDVVTIDPGTTCEPIHREARRTGVPL
ncbi:nucleotidyltransferase domain-containing protein [Thioalkalivibrio sp. ALE11]|uniref:nucleotidyltransferase domain-containing protein n=1 Tax=Thioalkalivibrio sp. ALE11 TaxID=1265494 RepID=UPI00037BDB40|nr:nucleotidyltransferase domain-containing protein [Thioalkalivibrio sp. ALE11]